MHCLLSTAQFFFQIEGLLQIGGILRAEGFLLVGEWLLRFIGACTADDGSFGFLFLDDFQPVNGVCAGVGLFFTVCVCCFGLLVLQYDEFLQIFYFFAHASDHFILPLYFIAQLLDILLVVSALPL